MAINSLTARKAIDAEVDNAVAKRKIAFYCNLIENVRAEIIILCGKLKYIRITSIK